MPVGYVQIRLPIGVAGPFWKNKPSSFTRFRFQKLTADLGIAVDRFRRLRPKPSIISTVLICASKTSGSCEVRGEILKKLAKEKEEFGDSLNEVVNVLREFLQKEYGGPGTFILTLLSHDAIWVYVDLDSVYNC